MPVESKTELHFADGYPVNKCRFSDLPVGAAFTHSAHVMDRTSARDTVFIKLNDYSHDNVKCISCATGEEEVTTFSNAFEWYFWRVSIVHVTRFTVSGATFATEAQPKDA